MPKEAPDRGEIAPSLQPDLAVVATGLSAVATSSMGASAACVPRTLEDVNPARHCLSSLMACGESGKRLRGTATEDLTCQLCIMLLDSPGRCAGHSVDVWLAGCWRTRRRDSTRASDRVGIKERNSARTASFPAVYRRMSRRVTFSSGMPACVWARQKCV